MPKELASLTVSEWIAAASDLVNADDPAEIQRLETMLECTRDEAVSHFIEESCCGLDLLEFSGGKGTPEERLTALRALWRAYAVEGETTNA